jgi:hypothetical protein
MNVMMPQEVFEAVDAMLDEFCRKELPERIKYYRSADVDIPEAAELLEHVYHVWSKWRQGVKDSEKVALSDA